MAEQADVYVKNMFAGDIIVKRIFPDGSDDGGKTIIKGGEESYMVFNSQESLIIGVPDGKVISDSPLTIQTSIIDLNVSCTESNWTIKIVPNTLQGETPTTVNISPGGVAPG